MQKLTPFVVSHNGTFIFILILTSLLITYSFWMKNNLWIRNNLWMKNNVRIPIKPSPPIRAVVTTLIRSDNISVFFAINMLHSVLRFHPSINNRSYPILIFHDRNFTTYMRQQILLCVLTNHTHVQITFALVPFNTTVKPSSTSPPGKTIGYRLMCRFWTYDVFYHPAIVEGRYDYLMRMDADSYFSDRVPYDFFHFIDTQKLDYIYRSTYRESSAPMNSILKRYLTRTSTIDNCIYNNFFVIRLQWFYGSKRVQSFIHELIDDDLMLREYIGDGCIHAAMIQIDLDMRVLFMTDIPYGHNFHVAPPKRFGWRFHPTDGFLQEMNRSCEQLIVLRAYYRRFIYILGFIYLIIWIIVFQPPPPSISLTLIDKFLTSTSCGRLIHSPDVILTDDELTELNNEASFFFSSSTDCSLFAHQIQISSEELAHPLAYTILVHSNLEQFDFLLGTIYRHFNYYCIHVDSKSSQSFYQSIVDRSHCVTNIFILEKRLNVTWGWFKVLEAEHLCQQELLKQSKEWKYYFNLANSDVPLKTNFELVKILKLYNEQNDITSLPYRSQLRQNNPKVNRTLPKTISLPLYKGEFHVLLTRETVEYIHSDSRVADLYDYLNGTMVPDEHYYSIINRWRRTPGFYPYNHDLSQISFMTRYKIWVDRPESRLCRGGFVRGICVFNYGDLWHLATSPHMFGNKVFVERDRVTPYCLARYLNIRDQMRRGQREFSMVDEEFYKQLKNVQYGKEKYLNK